MIDRRPNRSMYYESFGGTENSPYDFLHLPTPSSTNSKDIQAVDLLEGIIDTQLASYLSRVRMQFLHTYGKTHITSLTVSTPTTEILNILDVRNVKQEFMKFTSSVRSIGVVRPQKYQYNPLYEYVAYSVEDILSVGALWYVFNEKFPDSPVNDLPAIVETREETITRLGESPLATHLLRQPELPDFYPRNLRRKLPGTVKTGESGFMEVTSKTSRVLKR